jgi:glycosyltransferase involved in cell wall biosynthesis
MLLRKNSIVFLASYLDACALWRLYYPFWNMPGSSFFCFAQGPKYEHILSCDIAVVQRCCTQPQFELIRTMKGLGMKIIYDLDDNIWEIPKGNPAYEILGRMRDGFIACIQIVDTVTTSTRNLAVAVKKHVKNLTNQLTGKEIPIVVVENRLDTKIFAKPRKSDKIIVGWAGSSSHIVDLPIITDALKNCASSYPDVTFEFRGCDPPSNSGLHELKNFRHKLWTPVAEYCARMPLWDWSMALAPVTDHEFNASKSCIKMIEAGFCKIPCLASWVAPYEGFCRHDPELQWLLCAGPANWEKKLRVLIEEPARREYLGERMHKVMMEHYSWDRPHEGWLQALKIVRNL